MLHSSAIGYSHCYALAQPLPHPKAETTAAIGSRMNRIDRWLAITFANSDKANGILAK
ncbi:MAG: hypothetical protein LH613_05805 [Chamaesiphon sp.]|nr:hypothetical protein [Chamaesiphon sp.]